MDTGLFQALALVLLAVIAILLGAMASLLARIRHALEQANLGEANLREASSAQQAAALSASSAQAAEGAATEARPEEARVEAVRRLEPTPAAEATGYAQEEEAAPRAVSVFEAEEAASATGPEDEPQEQPFERDGRWWFRRGDELLVYDEQTGQWLAAPAPTVAGSVAQGAQGATPSAAVATETRTSVSELSANSEPSSSEHSGGFWKCPSCGAVNGSTATSCRMCFSARPS